MSRNFDQSMRGFERMLDAIQKKKDKTAFNQDIRSRQMAEQEADGRLARKTARGENWMKAENDYLSHVQGMQRNSDAFEVSAGRKSPDYFNMKYGGGAPTGGRTQTGKASSTGGAGGLSDSIQVGINKTLDADYRYAKENGQLIPDADGNMPTFDQYDKQNRGRFTRGTGGQAGVPQQSGQEYYQEQARKQDALELAQRDDWANNKIQSYKRPDGALAFSDNGFSNIGIPEGTKVHTGFDSTVDLINQNIPTSMGNTKYQVPPPDMFSVKRPEYGMQGKGPPPSVAPPIGFGTSGGMANPHEMNTPMPKRVPRSNPGQIFKPKPKIVDTGSFSRLGQGIKSAYNNWAVPGAQAFNKTMSDIFIDPFKSVYTQQGKSRRNSIRKWQGYK